MKKTYWKHVKNILCVRPDAMGDVLMTTPAFRAIKESFVGARLTLLTSKAGASITNYIPEIDDVISADMPWEKTTSGGITGREMLTLIHDVAVRNFDAAIIFNTFSQSPFPSAMICYLAGIPRRLAYSHKKAYSLLTDRIPDNEPHEFIRHEVERQLYLVGEIGATTSDTKLSLKIPSGFKTHIANILSATGIDTTKILIVIHPGAQTAKRRYDSSGFMEIIRRFNSKKYQVICTGSAEDTKIVRSITRNAGDNVFSLAGALPLSDFIALISISSLLISNNTGPVHIAAALNIPVIDLYALTNPQHTPWQVKSSVLYFEVPQHLKTGGIVLEDIPENAKPLIGPEQVFSEALQLLSL